MTNCYPNQYEGYGSIQESIQLTGDSLLQQVTELLDQRNSMSQSMLREFGEFVKQTAKEIKSYGSNQCQNSDSHQRNDQQVKEGETSTDLMLPPKQVVESTYSQLERLEEQHLQYFILEPAQGLREQQDTVHEPLIRRTAKIRMKLLLLMICLLPSPLLHLLLLVMTCCSTSSNALVSVMMMSI